MNKGLRTLMWLLVVPLLILMVIGVCLQLNGYSMAAFWVADMGTFFVLLADLFIVSVLDPMKRWPNLTPFQRLVRVLTFQR